MVAKLSSASTMSAASLAASVPFWPMATPTSARLSAGASLTPSPVIATTWPSSCSACTRRSLCSGLARANTSTSIATRRSAASSISASSAPVRAGLPTPMASCAPMARAVSTWSPVIIFTRMPARWHSRDGADGLLARRVDDAHQAQHREAVLHVGEAQPLARRPGALAGQPEQAQAARRGVVGHAAPGVHVDRALALVAALEAADVEHALRRALDEDPRLRRRHRGARWP